MDVTTGDDIFKHEGIRQAVCEERGIFEIVERSAVYPFIYCILHCLSVGVVTVCLPLVQGSMNRRYLTLTRVGDHQQICAKGTSIVDGTYLALFTFPDVLAPMGEGENVSSETYLSNAMAGSAAARLEDRVVPERGNRGSRAKRLDAQAVISPMRGVSLIGALTQR